MSTSSSTPFPTLGGYEHDGFIPQIPEEFIAEEAEQMGLNIPQEEPIIHEVELLATGGTGQIFSAKDDVLGRTIAVKTLKPRYQYDTAQMERLVREAKAAAQLEHPNIVPIHSLGISPSRGLYFSMKRLRGDSLRHIITQLAEKNPGYTREYTLTARLNIFIKICQGVSYAHSKQIIHRDLKPENVLVGNFGEVTIIDWGLVKKMDTDKKAARKPSCRQTRDRQMPANPFPETVDLTSGNLTLTGEINGTPRFMSPEQVIGESSDIDTRTDIYALGIILYELLTFTNPFSQLTEEDDILNAVARGQYLRPRQTFWGEGIPPELEAICLKAMHVNRENRYQAVVEIIKDIVAHMDGKPVSAYNAPAAVRTLKCFRRNPIKTTIFLSSCFAIVAFMLANYFLTALTTSETIGNAVFNFNLAAQKLRSLEKSIKQNTEEMTPELEEQFQTELNEIDNLALSANFYLSKIPNTQQNSRDLIRHRERNIIDRIRFTLNYGKLTDIQNVRGMLRAQYADNFSKFSPELQHTVGLLDSALEGQCTLSIVSDSDFATFDIFPVLEGKTGDKFLGPKLDLDTHTVPADNLIIPKGTYAATFYAEGKESATLYFTLTHGENARININLPAQIPLNMAFIPEGKKTIPKRSANSGERDDYTSTLQPPFFISLYEVTYAEYHDFWMQLPSSGLKAKFMPKIRMSPDDERTIPAWNKQGVMSIRKLRGKPMFLPNMPVVGISHEAAAAFCTWKGKQLHRTCRLPNADEWLRAATGDDGRSYPWGNSFNSKYALLKDNREAHTKYPLTAPIASFPKDISPYKIYDMGGNAREWTATTFTEDNVFQVRGASYATTQRYLPLDKPSSLSAFPSDIGFRYVIEYQEDIDSIPLYLYDQEQNPEELTPTED